MFTLRRVHGRISVRCLDGSEAYFSSVTAALNYIRKEHCNE